MALGLAQGSLNWGKYTTMAPTQATIKLEPLEDE